MDCKASLAGQARRDYGKQQCHHYQVFIFPVWEAGKNPKSGTRKSKDKEVEGSLKRNQLEPRKLIFYDQYESKLPGRVLGNR